MKTLILISMVFPFLILAQEAPSAPAIPTNCKKADDGRTIVIQESPGKIIGTPKVFVEGGSEELSGSPEGSIRAAYRQWENRCKEWKSELRNMNGNNLMIASCGTPKRASETIQSEPIYTYSSKGTYKIKVVGK